MAHEHPKFWFELVANIGPPVFAAALVGCLLSHEWTMMHGILMGIGLALIVVGHWGMHHWRH
jgi:hypothetical protein